MKKIFFISILFFGITSVAFGQTTSTTNQTCTGEIRTNLADAQACANIAQTQGASYGYNTTCTVEKVPLVAGIDPLSGLDYYYNTTCTVNGSTGHSAYLLAGFQAASTSNAIVQTVPSGWNVLRTELSYEAAYSQCGGTPYVINGSYSCNPPSSGASPYVLTNTTKTTTSGTNSTGTGGSTGTQLSPTSAAQTIQNNILNAVRSLATGVVDRYRTAVGLSSTGTDKGQTGTASGSLCAVPTRNLNRGDSGDDVLKLTQILVAEGLLSTTQTGFDQTVFDAVVKYQEKYAAKILTPLGISKGTGFVGDSTRTFMQNKCSSNTTTPTNPTAPSLPQVFYPESNAYCSVVRPFPISATRLKIASQVNKGWVGFGEIEIYDMQGNLIKPTWVYADSTYGIDVASNAFDGNKNIGWNAGPTTTCTPEYCWHSATLYIDLGGLKQISKVKLYNKSTPAPAQANYWVMYTTSDRFGQEYQASKISGTLQGDTWYETCSKDSATSTQ